MTSLLGILPNNEVIHALLFLVTQVRRGPTTNRLAYFEYYQQFTHFNRVRMTCMQETHQNEYIQVAFLIEACAYRTLTVQNSLLKCIHFHIPGAWSNVSVSILRDRYSFYALLWCFPWWESSPHKIFKWLWEKYAFYAFLFFQFLFAFVVNYWII